MTGAYTFARSQRATQAIVSLGERPYAREVAGGEGGFRDPEIQPLVAVRLQGSGGDAV